jgi:hypothetical protein
VNAITRNALCDPKVAWIAGRAPLAHLAVETAGEPHVTPVLFASTPGRLWFAIARRTLKARMLRKHPRLGVLIDGGPAAIVISGEAELLDPARPGTSHALAPLGLLSYGMRNTGELLGFARDALRERLRPAAHNLVLVSVQPDTTAVFHRPAPQRATAGAPRARAFAGVPDELVSLAHRPGPVVLGWMTPDGPVALPATWDPGRSSAHISASALAHAGGDGEGTACLCFDVTRGWGPNAKAGLLLRGPARIASDGNAGAVTLEPERITYWTGFETASTKSA